MRGAPTDPKFRRSSFSPIPCTAGGRLFSYGRPHRSRSFSKLRREGQEQAAVALQPEPRPPCFLEPLTAARGQKTREGKGPGPARVVHCQPVDRGTSSQGL